MCVSAFFFFRGGTIQPSETSFLSAAVLLSAFSSSLFLLKPFIPPQRLTDQYICKHPSNQEHIFNKLCLYD